MVGFCFPKYNSNSAYLDVKNGNQLPRFIQFAGSEDHEHRIFGLIVVSGMLSLSGLPAPNAAGQDRTQPAAGKSCCRP
jgi:hypothetical protein